MSSSFSSFTAEKGTGVKKKKKQKKQKPPEYNQELQATYLEIVDTQLRDDTPPEVRQTFERLVEQGFSIRDARLLIGSAIAYETFGILKYGIPYDRERYLRHLNMLPDQSFIDEEPSSNESQEHNSL